MMLMKKGDHFQELPETLLLTTTEGICPLIVKIVQGINNHEALLAKTVHPFFLGTDLARDRCHYRLLAGLQ